jgi:hypothetical protein
MSKFFSQTAWLSLICALGISASAAWGQTAPEAKGDPSTDPPPKWDVFAGYSYLDPDSNTVVQVPKPTGSSIDTTFDSVNLGGLFSGAFFFNRHFGAQVEFGEHEWGNGRYPNPVGTEGNNDGFMTLAAGPIVRFPVHHFVPFVHFVAGGAYVNGPYFNPNVWRSDLTAGGGLDLVTPWFHNHLAFRLAQVDDEIMQPLP